MTDGFIMKYSRFMDWQLLSAHYDFSLDMLRTYQHRVSWAHVLRRKRFPESFLREMVSNFNDCWEIVCKYQTLSESFVHDFADRVDWENVLLYQEVNSHF